MVRVKIEKLVHGGQSMARLYNGQVIFVNGGIPGETVDIETLGTKGGIATAEVTNIAEPSAQRRTPPCPYFGSCGGCSWQHMTYDAQLRAKVNIFDECLSRIGKLRIVPPSEVYESPEWAYRCRAQYKLDWDSKTIGFYRHGTNEVIPIESCPLLVSSLNEPPTSPQAPFHLLPHGTRELKVLAGNNGRIASSPVCRGLTVEKTEIRVGDTCFQVSGGGFFQGNQFLHETLGRWAEPHVSGEYFIDLYGGAGFFSVLLGKRFAKGVLIESSRTLIENAVENLSLNGLSHVVAIEISAERFVSRLDLPKEFSPDLVVVDPPRPGLTKKAMENLISLHPRSILYVSCNPATQARDIGKLIHQHDYNIDRRALFDLYPQTHHLETAVLLRSK